MASNLGPTGTAGLILMVPHFVILLLSAGYPSVTYPYTTRQNHIGHGLHGLARCAYDSAFAASSGFL